MLIYFHMKKITKKLKLTALSFLFFLLASFVFLCIYRYNIFTSSSKEAKELTLEQISSLELVFGQNYKKERSAVHPLPYKVLPKQMEIASGSAILINCNTGDILFEKNADKIIPPASMIKLFLMYTIFNQIKEGRLELNQIVPLTKESFACNMPPNSSLMFLGKNQKVTVEELLKGLAISSGNDASYALAIFTFGTMENFLLEVNKEIASMNLVNTHIVEPSGYSEKNTTTAREMASFCRTYINTFPESLEKFHSLKKNIYPQIHNIAKSDIGKSAQDFSKGIPESIWTPIEIENTNKLLWSLDGCDGLKTGHIDESGYNLALTAKRGNIRYLSITMLGPGKNLNEGNYFRKKDGTSLQEWAFSTFTETAEFSGKIKIKLLGGKENFALLIPPYSTSFAYPIADSTLSVKVETSPYIFGTVKQGDVYGKLVYSSNNKVLCEVPLCIDRNVEKSNAIIYFADFLISFLLK